MFLNAPTLLAVLALGNGSDGRYGVDEHEQSMCKAWLDRLVDEEGNPKDDQGRTAMQHVVEEDMLAHNGSLSSILRGDDRVTMSIVVSRRVRTLDRAEPRSFTTSTASRGWRSTSSRGLGRSDGDVDPVRGSVHVQPQDGGPRQLRRVGRRLRRVAVRAASPVLREQLFRVTRPGTNACIHVQQLVATKVEHGFIGRRNFRDDTIEAVRGGRLRLEGRVRDPEEPAGDRAAAEAAFAAVHHGGRDARQLAPAVNDYVLCSSAG
jgi:hypothetical protein